MIKVLTLGLVIYMVWKIAEGFFGGNKTPKEKPPQKDKNTDDEGFTPFEEIK